MKGSWRYFASEKQAGDHCHKSGLFDDTVSSGSSVIAAIVFRFTHIKLLRSKRTAIGRVSFRYPYHHRLSDKLCKRENDQALRSDSLQNAIDLFDPQRQQRSRPRWDIVQEYDVVGSDAP